MGRLGFPRSAKAACISAISLCFMACGLGSDMDVGDERGSQKPGSGGGGGDGYGGSATSGGSTATGGTPGGGATAAGGVTATGGTPAAGGIRASGGSSSGGAVATGGVRAAGGAIITVADGGTTGGAGGGQGVPCGPNTCGVGLLCCNASCGICAPPGAGCTQQACENPPTGVPCGNTVCQTGETCCNPSCGICVEKGGGCTQQICEPKSCTVNGDCRVEADYCTGCNCRALATGEALPICTGPGVNCLVDPCDGKTSVCRSGKCVVQ